MPNWQVKLKPLEYAALHLETPKSEGADALSTQHGGDHYKSLKIQPMEYSMANNLDACQHTAIKYITRYESKGGEGDLDKAIHCIQLLKHFKYPTSGD